MGKYSGRGERHTTEQRGDGGAQVVTVLRGLGLQSGKNKERVETHAGLTQVLTWHRLYMLSNLVWPERG